MPDTSDHEPHAGPSRRTVVRTAAWAAPAVVVATAAPAVAATNDAWIIKSLSYEGSNNGTRNNNGNYRMRFTIAVAPRATVESPTMQLTLRLAAGDGAEITGVTAAAPSTTIGGFTVTGSVNEPGTDQFHRFTFEGSDIAGGASGTTVSLNFNLLGVDFGDINAGSNAVFSAGNSAIHPTTTFQLLAANVDTYITDPAGP